MQRDTVPSLGCTKLIEFGFSWQTRLTETPLKGLGEQEFVETA